MIFSIAKASLFNRKQSVILTISAIAISLLVLMGVEHIRNEAKSNFSNTVSGTDLIVGARTGEINLLLYAIFHIGNATNNIGWTSYQKIANDPKVKWTIPISLGDSHRGFRVIGTDDNFLKHYRYGQKQNIKIKQGAFFKDLYDVTLGSEVAKKLNYKLGDKIILAHGIGSNTLAKHDDKPFTVTGILAPTATPVDQSLLVSLAAIEAIHVDWQHGTRIPGLKKQITEADLIPKQITAMMVGLKNKIATFAMQRQINEYRREAIMAILPGVALSELWQMSSALEYVLVLIAYLVLAAALLGMCTMLLSSLSARSRELAILRAAGASPWFIFWLIEIEVLMIILSAIVTAIVALFLALTLGNNFIVEHYGLFIGANFLTLKLLAILGIIAVVALVVGALPALQAYRQSLQQGLIARE